MAEATTRPRRIQLRRTKGWRKPPGAVVVTRGTDWGNPFIIGTKFSPHEPHPDASITPAGPVVALTRELAVAMFAAYVEQRGWEQQIRDDLAGRDLACWCPEGEPCHADVLLAIANPEEASRG